MIFVFGGFAQNKLQFTLNRFDFDMNDVFDAEKYDFSLLKNKKVIYNFQYIIEKWIDNGLEPLEEIYKNIDFLEDKIIISNDVGCGIVPIDSKERKFREAVGRINCILAEKSHTVYRVCCGIGMLLKGGEEKCGS